MEKLFYLTLIYCIIIEMMQFADTKEVLKLTNELRDKDLKVKSDEAKVYSYMSLFYMLVCLIGLMSSQWFLFLALLIMSLVPKGNNIPLRKVDALLSLFILIFILINRFHLHITII